MSFATNELISSTKLVRNFGSILAKLKDNSFSKIWILKNNEIEAVILSREEYENYEKMLKYLEDLQDIKLAEERLASDDWTRYTHEEMLKMHNISL